MRQPFILSFIAIISFSFFTSNYCYSQPAIDGDMGDGDYNIIGTFTSGNDGFGGDNDLGEIKYHTDGSSIFLGITGELTSNDHILFAFNFSGYDGRDAGATLGAGSSGVFSTIGSSALDMDTDFALAFNEGGSSTDFYIDAARYGTGGILNDGYVGNVAAQDGTPNSLDVGSHFGGSGNMTIAYHNNFAGDSDNGIELSIPISAFEGVDNTQSLQVFAVIVSSGGFYSNETIPGDTGDGNPGNDFDFSSVPDQDFFTNFLLLPVQLTRFTAQQEQNRILLNWQTALEINNDHFIIESSKNGIEFQAIGKVEGAGTSYQLREYSFLDESPFLGINYYRLKQVDVDGKYAYSEFASAEHRQSKTELYPNPVAENVTLNLGEINSGKVVIYDSQGKVLDQIIYQEVDQIEIDLTGFGPGMLVVEIQDAKGTMISVDRLMKL